MIMRNELSISSQCAFVFFKLVVDLRNNDRLNCLFFTIMSKYYKFSSNNIKTWCMVSIKLDLKTLI